MAISKNDQSWLLEKAIIGIGFVAIGSLMFWIFWHIYMWLVAYWFPTASDKVLHPNFFIFAGTWIVVMWLLRVIRGVFRK